MRDISISVLIPVINFDFSIDKPVIADSKESRVSTENDLYDFNMESSKNDVIKVSVAKSQNIIKISHDINSPPILNVTGCSLSSVNGRYIEAGYSNQCMRFKNVKGWVIFRQSLKEIPELGIYADSCYDAFKGPSQRDLLDRRAGVYFALLNKPFLKTF